MSVPSTLPVALPRVASKHPEVQTHLLIALAAESPKALDLAGLAPADVGRTGLDALAAGFHAEA